MFDVGFWELVLIFGVGLIILGPERMPRVASQIGRWIGRARRTASTLRRQLEQEIATADAPPPRKPKPLQPVNRPPDKPEIESAEGAAEQSVDAPAVELDAAVEVAKSLAAKGGEGPEAKDKDGEQNTIGPASGL
jgi:Tat protein translocase TatB subunit